MMKSNTGIFIIKEDQKLVPLTQQTYESEDLLQTLLAQYPSLLAGDQIRPESPRRWILIKREMEIPGEIEGTGRWSLDHLFLDQDGIPTLVEVKRSSDTRIRREVVGQMLDYAANSVKYWPIEKLRSSFEETCEAQTIDSEMVIKELIGDIGDITQFWTNVKTNLQAGRIRMLFVADEIPDELRRIIEFLNEQMDPAEVLGVEIKQYIGESLKTLVPRVIGQTSEAEDRKNSGSRGVKRQWDESTFFSEMKIRRGTNSVEIARKILDWAKAHTTRIWWGQGATNGSFVPVLEFAGENHQPFAVFTGAPRENAIASIELYFYWWASKAPFNDKNKRIEILNKLNSIEGISIPIDGIDRRPNIPLDTMSNETTLKKFLDVMDWYTEQIKTQK